MKELFWQRFDVAEMCGPETIKGVAEVSFDEYKDDIEGLTMLVMAINHKSWAHHDIGNEKLSNLYADLYYEYYEKAINLLEKESRDKDLTYFIRTLD